MAFTIPNAATAPFAAQAIPYQTDIDILAYDGGVMSGCGVTSTGAANQGVTVAAGRAMVADAAVAVAGGTVTLTAPHASLPRIDLVWVNSAGTIGKTDGIAATTPVPPALPASTVALAMVYSPQAGGATVGATWIVDKRTNVNTSDIKILRCVLDGGGSVLTTGAKKAYINVPVDCTIVRWRMFADPSGSIVVDIWKDTYANYPPTVADTITASAKPTITTATKAENTTLTGWTTALSAGDVLEFNVDSVSSVTKCYVDLFVQVR